jgi:DNA-binding response OmpR family regulator
MSGKILVIDDDDDVRETICDILRAAGYEVEQASDGDQGLRAFGQTGFDLIVTDILMPQKEGIETILEIRDGNPEIKIIAISGGDRTGNYAYLEMAKKLGADKTLKKPFAPRQLLDLIEGILKREA